jgi:tetratricopeptide (TPR) repeat protein
MYSIRNQEREPLPDAARSGALEHFLNGLMAIQEEDFERGAREFEAALKLDPQYSYAYLGLGKTFLEMNQFQRAIEYFKTYLSMNPKSVEGLILQGISYYEAGGLEDAREKFEQALNIQRHSLRPLLEEEIRLDGEAHLSDARSKLVRALLVGPADRGALRMLGDIYHKLGATGSAERIKTRLAEQEATEN